MGTVDWSELPLKFHHLIPSFELYGSLQFENEIFRKLKTISNSELQEVKSLSTSLSPIEDELLGWIDTIGLTKSRAAALVYFTLYFLDIGKYHGYLTDSIDGKEKKIKDRSITPVSLFASFFRRKKP